MTTTFEKAKAGDKVWCMRSGWGEIWESSWTGRYPIYVRFPCGEFETYTVDGLYDDEDLNQTLFWGEVVIDAPQKPRSDSVLPVEEKQISALRDQIAMQAMNGLLSNSGGVIQSNGFSGTGYVNCSHDDVAAWAYELADAMLKERSK